MKYIIYHIDGVENRLTDLGSRWGSRFAKTRNESPGVVDGLTGGPKPLMNCFLRRMREAAPVVKAALRTKPPTADDKVKRPDVDLSGGFTVPAPTHLLDRKKIAASQRANRTKRPKGLRQSKERPKL